MLLMGGSILCVCVLVSGIKVRSLVGLSALLRFPLMILPLHRTYVVVVREADELLCCGCKWVSRFESLCNSTRRLTKTAFDRNRHNKTFYNSVGGRTTTLQKTVAKKSSMGVLYVGAEGD